MVLVSGDLYFVGKNNQQRLPWQLKQLARQALTYDVQGFEFRLRLVRKSKKKLFRALGV